MSYNLSVEKMFSELLLEEVMRELANVRSKVTAVDIDRFIAANLVIYSADVRMANIYGDNIYLLEARVSLGKVIGAIIQKIKMKHCG